MISRRSALAAALLAAGACKKPKPETPAPPAPAPEVEIDAKAPGLFTYVTGAGAFETVDKPDAVPEGARRMVRFVDPAQPAGERSDGTTVLVVDVDELLRTGKARARAMSRVAFETGALAQLPAGESSAWPRADGAGAGGAAGDASAPPVAGDPVVIVYGTSWCGACRSARQYLSSRKIPFADKDIERDPAAARELAEKGARLGVPTDRVPVLDVRGRLLLGFDKARLEALLGQPS